MRQIWKYQLSGSSMLQVPDGGEALCVQMQGCHPTLWMMVDPAMPLAPRQFMIVGTGAPLPDSMAGRDAFPYVGTVQDGDLVWHVFERRLR